MSSATASDPRYLKQDENGKWIVAVDTTIAPAKRGRRPGTPNPNGGRHPSTAPKTRVSLTAEAAELLAEFAARVNEARGQATRQDEIASAIMVKYLNSALLPIDPGEIAIRIDYARDGKPDVEEKYRAILADHLHGTKASESKITTYMSTEEARFVSYMIKVLTISNEKRISQEAGK